MRQPVATAALVGTGVALVTGLLHPAAGAVALAVSAAGAIAFVLARRAATASEELLVARRAALGTSVEEVAHGLRELEQWGATDRAFVAVRSESDALAGAVRRSARAVAAGTALTSAAAGLGVIAVAASVSPGSVSPAVLALLLLVPLALADVTAGLADAGALSVRARAARERLDRLAHTPPAVSDPPAPLPVPATHGVEMVDVGLGWSDQGQPVLTLEHLGIRPGEHLGVTGPSGSGKSTLAATLVRFIDPLTGEVLLGGTDLRSLALDDVRAAVGLVDDDPHVFASTVAENVRLARPGPQTRRFAPRSTGPAWVRGSTIFPTGCTRTWGQAGARCPAANGPGSPWPGRCWPTLPCWCSTSRPPTSTPPPPAPSHTRCWARRRVRDARSSGSPTAPSGWTTWTGWSPWARSTAPAGSAGRGLAETAAAG